LPNESNILKDITKIKELQDPYLQAEQELGEALQVERFRRRYDEV